MESLPGPSGSFSLQNKSEPSPQPGPCTLDFKSQPPPHLAPPVNMRFKEELGTRRKDMC